MSAGSSPKRTFLCECTNVVFVAGDTVSMEFIWPGPAPRGGQFFLIKPRRTGVFLGRPISAAGYKPGFQPSALVSENMAKGAAPDENAGGGDGAAAGTLRFFVARRGRGSRELVDLRPGEEAELTGPLGNYWAQMNIPKGSIALVGGGIGIAPLLAFVPELAGIPRDIIPFDFYAGFRTGSFGLENIKSQAPGLRSLIIATEDGSQGVRGRIPDFFTPSGYSAVFACGPEPMLKVVGDACIAAGVPCYISVEKRMACGVGACLGCTVKTTLGNRQCCTDGPIFNALEICFDSKRT